MVQKERPMPTPASVRGAVSYDLRLGIFLSDAVAQGTRCCADVYKGCWARWREREREALGGVASLRAALAEQGEEVAR